MDIAQVKIIQFSEYKTNMHSYLESIRFTESRHIITITTWFNGSVSGTTDAKQTHRQFYRITVTNKKNFAAKHLFVAKC